MQRIALAASRRRDGDRYRQQGKVTTPAVYKALKKCGLETSRSMVAGAVEDVLRQKIDAIDQLTNINKHTNEILETLMNWAKGDEEAIQVLEKQIKRVNIGTRKEPQWIEMLNSKDPRELALKAVAEIRKQINTALAIQKTLWRIEDVKEVLDAIIRIIKKHVPPEVQNLIAEEVRKQRSLTLEVKG